MQRRHQVMAEAYGNQPAGVVEEARGRARQVELPPPRITAQEAVTFAKNRSFERAAVVDERTLRRDALSRSMGEVSVGSIAVDFERRVSTGEFLGVPQPPGNPGRAFTTREMIALERETIHAMRGRQQTEPALASDQTRRGIRQAYPHLSESQHAAVGYILASRDQVVALEGVAGAGKTTALAAVRDGAERAGYRVEGLAPTSRAAQKLGESGISSSTLQRHLARREASDVGPRLYVLDESSLASTRQMRDLVKRLAPQDRVLLVGDVRQHEAVDAGRPYRQLQDAGMATARLDAIVRQKDPALKQVVEQLARGEVRGAIQDLERQGRVHEVHACGERFTAIAEAYAAYPEGTLVVSPDHQSRRTINETIHSRMQIAGHVELQEHRMRVLVPRQDVTGADRQWAAQYAPGDIVRYTAGSTVFGIRAGEYARVDAVDVADNRVTVARQTGGRVTYDPRRLQGVTLYQEAERAFAVGDRVQITAPYKERHITNRELGTITQLDPQGQLQLRLDSGRTVAFRSGAHPHLDYGYAVTSHSSQGQTADRVLVHVDTDATVAPLVNRRLAYVAVSRGRFDAQIYTNNQSQLGDALSRDASHRSAIELGSVPAAVRHNQDLSAPPREAQRTR